MAHLRCGKIQQFDRNQRSKLELKPRAHLPWMGWMTMMQSKLGNRQKHVCEQIQEVHRKMRWKDASSVATRLWNLCIVSIINVLNILHTLESYFNFFTPNKLSTSFSIAFLRHPYIIYIGRGEGWPMRHAHKGFGTERLIGTGISEDIRSSHVGQAWRMCGLWMGEIRAPEMLKGEEKVSLPLPWDILELVIQWRLGHLCYDTH